MDAAEYEALAEKAQQLADNNFSRYKLNVTAYAVLGYVVIIGVLLALVAIIGGLGGLAFYSTAAFLILLKKKVLFILIPLAWVLLRALWVKMEHPKGFALERERFSVLFKELDDLSAALNATKIDQVLLTPELNAAVIQTPRLGIFGWQRNTLFLGLELLLTMSPEQARAVIAHELGHLSGNHSAFNGWIYRVRQSWHRIMTSLQDESSMGSAIMGKFFNWYAPRFSAYSFALARKNEFEADAISAELTSPVDAGAALVNVTVTAPYIDANYWSEYFKTADTTPQPEQLPWIGLHKFLRSNNNEDLEKSLEQALEQQTNFDDTHPSLSDRLSALNVSPTLPTQSTVSAAQAWFDTEYTEVLGEFDENWLEGNGERWTTRFNYVKTSRETLHSFATRRTESFNDEELWERVILSEEFEPTDIALIAMREYQHRFPEDPDIAFVLGRNLFAQEDEACLAEFEKAVAGPATAFEACQYAFWFENGRDREDAAELWREKAMQAQQESTARTQERQCLNVEDELRTVDLSAERAEALVAALKACKMVKKAWVAEKVLQFEGDYRAYAVAVTLRGIQLTPESAQKSLTEKLDVDAWLIPKYGDFKPLAKHIIKFGERVK